MALSLSLFTFLFLFLFFLSPPRLSSFLFWFSPVTLQKFWWRRRDNHEIKVYFNTFLSNLLKYPYIYFNFTLLPYLLTFFWPNKFLLFLAGYSSPLPRCTLLKISQINLIIYLLFIYSFYTIFPPFLWLKNQFNLIKYN